MIEYKKKIVIIVLKWIILNFIAFLVLIYGFKLKIDKNFLIGSSIFIAFSVTGATVLGVKQELKEKIQINDLCFCLIKAEKYVLEETKISWRDIIKSNTKKIIGTELKLYTAFKSVSIKLSEYKNHKKMLTIILQKTEHNKNIRIDEAVYNILN